MSAVWDEENMSNLQYFFSFFHFLLFLLFPFFSPFSFLFPFFPFFSPFFSFLFLFSCPKCKVLLFTSLQKIVKSDFWLCFLYLPWSALATYIWWSIRNRWARKELPYYVICLRHMIRYKVVINRTFFPSEKTYLSSCVRNMSCVTIWYK